MEVDKHRIAELVGKVQNGDNSAFEELYSLTSERAYFVALEFTKNSQDAEDILQESYIKALSKIKELDTTVVNNSDKKDDISTTAYTEENTTENLDLDGLALTVTYSDGTTETVKDTSSMKVTGFDNSKTGTQTVTVEYEGATATFDVTVSYAWWQWIIRILLLGFLWY